MDLSMKIVKEIVKTWPGDSETWLGDSEGQGSVHGVAELDMTLTTEQQWQLCYTEA